MISSEDFVSPLPITPEAPVNLPTLNRRPTGLSVLLLLLTGSFLYRTIASTVVIVILSKTISQSHSLLSIFSVAPIMGVFPVISAATVVFLTYLFLKTKDLSAGSYKLLLSSLVAIPLLYTLLIFFLLSQTQTAYTATSLDNSTSVNPLLSVFSAVFNEINLLSLITWLVVKKKKDLFTNPPTTLKTGAKMVLIVIGLVILIPTGGETYVFIHNSLYPDTKYSQIRKEVGFNIYQPLYLPSGIEINSQYFIDENNSLKMSNPTVKVAFDIPMKKLLAGSKSETIMLNQSFITDDFDLASYVSRQNPNDSPQKAEILTAVNKSGYAVEPAPKTGSSLAIKSLYFVTPTNIFINLATISPQISVQDLIKIANSLK